MEWPGCPPSNINHIFSIYACKYHIHRKLFYCPGLLNFAAAASCAKRMAGRIIIKFILVCRFYQSCWIRPAGCVFFAFTAINSLLALKHVWALCCLCLLSIIFWLKHDTPFWVHTLTLWVVSSFESVLPMEVVRETWIKVWLMFRLELENDKDVTETSTKGTKQCFRFPFCVRFRMWCNFVKGFKMEHIKFALR